MIRIKPCQVPPKVAAAAGMHRPAPRLAGQRSKVPERRAVSPRTLPGEEHGRQRRCPERQHQRRHVLARERAVWFGVGARPCDGEGMLGLLLAGIGHHHDLRDHERKDDPDVGLQRACGWVMVS